jgi:acyl carrier protein
MTHQEVLNHIETILATIAASKGLAAPKIDPNMQLLGGGLPMDSLDLAALVVELEMVTGYDPFKAGFINFRTAGELAKLYQR